MRGPATRFEAGDFPMRLRAFDRPGYDALDELVAELLLDRDLPPPSTLLSPDMVDYQATPARVIYQLAAHITANDVFYDLGSGLGQVAILVHRLTRAKTFGIELDPAYCEYARSSPLAAGVTFINDDVRNVDLSGGTVFYLYTPFRGAMLREVLAKLHGRVFTYGPCTLELGAGDSPDRLTLIRASRSSGPPPV